jgi:hypothetical protein
MKKYEIIKERGHGAVICALRDIYNDGELICRAGGNGALLDNQSEQILSQYGDCWADETSYVNPDSCITDNAFVSHSIIRGKTFVRDNTNILCSNIDNTLGGTIIICDHTYLNNINISNKNGIIIFSGYTAISNPGPFLYQRQFDIDIVGSPNVMFSNVTFIKPNSPSYIKIHIEHDVQFLGSMLPNLDDPQVYNEFINSGRVLIGADDIIKRSIAYKKIDIDYNYILYNPGIQDKNAILFPLDYIK